MRQCPGWNVGLLRADLLDFLVDHRGTQLDIAALEQLCGSDGCRDRGDHVGCFLHPIRRIRTLLSLGHAGADRQ